MKLGKTLDVADRKAWRAWLSKNHSREKEIWLVYYRKSSGKPRMPYNDAVEEALCFGWIDSQVKGINSEKYAQRFSPRNPKSGLSEMNRQRILKLIAQKKMTRAGLDAVADSLAPGRLKIAPDILGPLKADKEAWKNFRKMPIGYKRIRIAFIESRRRHGKEMFGKSLANFIRMTAKNKRFGFVKEFRD
ncbi:Bacteriocin-protection, YdeI or OmpD-Associated [uncultured archaeon]|nr:Bacteriocin-protection, YdeI or OmpD-Associated [uncultured archaeon]